MPLNVEIGNTAARFAVPTTLLIDDVELRRMWSQRSPGGCVCEQVGRRVATCCYRIDRPGCQAGLALRRSRWRQPAYRNLRQGKAALSGEAVSGAAPGRFAAAVRENRQNADMPIKLKAWTKLIKLTGP